MPVLSYVAKFKDEFAGDLRAMAVGPVDRRTVLAVERAVDVSLAPAVGVLKG